MSKKVLILSGSPRKGGNSDIPVSYTHLDVYKRQLRDAVFGHTPRFEGFRAGKQRAFFFQGHFFQQKFCILHMVFPSHKKSRIQRLQADIRRGFYSASTVMIYQGQWLSLIHI